MPTYDYRCDDCGHFFEEFQSMKDPKLTKCPACGNEALKRLIGTGSGLIFKGTGFYLTDYKNKPSESSASVSGNNSGKDKKTDTAVKETSSKENSKQTTEKTDTKTESKEKKTSSEKKE